MKRFVERDYTPFTVMKGGQLKSILVGLGSGVDKEKGVVVISRCTPQPVGQLLLQTVVNGVGIESQFLYLSGDGRHVIRMRVSDRDDGMSAIEVDILVPGRVPYAASFSTDYFYVEKGVNVK
jgi:hypothetical protein